MIFVHIDKNVKIYQLDIIEKTKEDYTKKNS